MQVGLYIMRHVRTMLQSIPDNSIFTRNLSPISLLLFGKFQGIGLVLCLCRLCLLCHLLLLLLLGSFLFLLHHLLILLLLLSIFLPLFKLISSIH